jgi:P pilus assembly chaperone PapD
MPKDRESAFWFNVLEIPPRKKGTVGQSQNQVQVAFRSKIKLFYRPEGLPGKPAEAARALRWALVKNGQGYALRATNSAVYHVSVGDVSITLAGKAYSNKEGGMIEPLKSFDFPIKGLSSTAGGGEITYNWINDYGSGIAQTTSLGQ